MFLSIFDIFKVGVGPSSSHTMGPMLAAARFREHLSAMDLPAGHLNLKCRLYGSLAYTGEGHGTFRAVLCGLLGMVPETYDRAGANDALVELTLAKTTRLSNGRPLGLDPTTAIIAERGQRLEGHPNGMIFVLEDGDQNVCASETYFSVGGGFVLTEAELAMGPPKPQEEDVPFPFGTSVEMLSMGEASGLSIAAMKRANEEARSGPGLDDRILAVWDVMDRCIERGLTTDGVLPGGLNVKRRAHGLSEKLELRAGANDAPLHSAVDWLQAFAMAVNEENAAGGQVVTAPTNGAAGVIPAVIRYYLDLVPGASHAQIPDMLLTAAAVGGLIKIQRVDLGRRSRMPGRSRLGFGNGRGSALRCVGGSNAQIEKPPRSRSNTIWG